MGIPEGEEKIIFTILWGDYSRWSCYSRKYGIYRYTVESPKTDTPRSGQPLYNGQTSWNGINLPRI